MTFKQAFCQYGLTGSDKRLKELNEEEEFSALVNWALNKLQYFHSMNLRHKVNGGIYQTPLHKNDREIRVGKPTLKTDYPGAITYDWNKETKYSTLDVRAITTAVERADIINVAKKERRLLTEQQVTEMTNPQINWNKQTQMEWPQVELERLERNCWDAVLTEEERNLIGEFLDV